MVKSRRCLSNSIPSDGILAVRREPLIALNATSGVLLSSAAKSALGQRGGVCGDVVPVGCSPLRVAATGRCRICVIRRHRPAIGLSPLYPQWLTSRVLLDHLVLLGTSTPSASSVFTKVLPENQNKSLAASGKSLALVRPARATMRDVCASSRNVARVAMDAAISGACARRTKVRRVRRSRVVLAPRPWRPTLRPVLDGQR